MVQAPDRRVLDLIRRIVIEEAGRLDIKVERVILFGSRSRGEATRESDWDLLIIVKDKLGWQRRLALFSRVHRRLVKLLEAPVDIIIIDIERFEERRRIPLTLEAEAERGVQLPM